jgi:hypothetical protein
MFGSSVLPRFCAMSVESDFVTQKFNFSPNWMIRGS